MPIAPHRPAVARAVAWFESAFCLPGRDGDSPWGLMARVWPPLSPREVLAAAREAARRSPGPDAKAALAGMDDTEFLEYLRRKLGALRGRI